MLERGPTEPEESIRATWLSGDFAGATTAALRLYGPEVLGFLVAVHRDETAAEEAFSIFTERLWRGIARFEWKCSVRTWSYVLARNASMDERRGEVRRRRGLASPSEAPISEIAARVRTETLSILRTEKRNAFTELRDELPEEDRVLLVLRVDRDLPWRDIARVLGADGDEDVTREAARLRKRFQLVKDRLRARAQERGIV
jgi:RNA polymerase sigma-70 factor (ECF subfamily)